MISYKDLLKNPELYQPLSSHKSVYNKATSPDFTNVDLEQLFLAKQNRIYLARSLYRVARDNGIHSTMDKFNNMIPVAQKTFCERNDLEAYRMAEEDAIGIRDFAELLRVVNSDFLKFMYSLLKWNTFNPYQEWASVGPSDKKVSKKFSDLTAEDMTTLDVYGNYTVETENKNHWLGNKIPMWRARLNTRHFDRVGIEGLRNGNPDRASLDNFQRGFDQSTVFGLIDKWTSKDWWGF